MPRLRQVLVLIYCCIGAVLLVACEKPTVSVNLHGVNYSGETFSYDVADPATPDKAAGGELIDPFGAGGTTCCVTLPRKWHPGIKLQVRTTHWLKKLSDGSLPEIKQQNLVDVPPYADGRPGELWVLRETDGKVSVISSDFQPDHAKWPGKVKGWPVPSLEYQREKWMVLEQHQRDFVEAYSSLLNKLEKTPIAHAKDAWEQAKKYEPASLTEFSGPNDPGYIAFLRKGYTQGLNESQVELKKLRETRP
jgi:hypothetical protein